MDSSFPDSILSPQRKYFPIPLIKTTLVTSSIEEGINTHQLEPPPFHPTESHLLEVPGGTSISSCKQLLPAIDVKTLELNKFSFLQLAHINTVLQSHLFTQATTFREQVSLMVQELRADECPPICTYAEIARMFNVKNAQSIRNQVKTGQKITHFDGRPSLITPEIAEFIQEVITDRYNSSDPVSVHELLDLVIEGFGVSISLDTFRHYIYRNPNIKIFKGDLMESKRVEINYQLIQDWYDELRILIKGVPRNFIYNMDESGIDEYVDSTHLSVLVPESHGTTKVPIPIPREIKRATLTGCISAASDSLKPFVILPRGTVDEELYFAGYTADKVTFHHHIHSFMTKRIFKLWMNSIFFPAIDEKMTQMNYNGNAVLILDKFSGHMYELRSTVQDTWSHH
jgi:hypothetical protein